MNSDCLLFLKLLLALFDQASQNQALSSLFDIIDENRGASERSRQLATLIDLAWEIKSRGVDPDKWES
jgi:hypothetical protein